MVQYFHVMSFEVAAAAAAAAAAVVDWQQKEYHDFFGPLRR